MVAARVRVARLPTTALFVAYAGALTELGGSVRIMKPILLPVRTYAQPEAQCGNTSLRMVCGFHRVHATIRELATLAGTTSEGTNHKDLVEAATKKGATVFVKDHGTLDELRFFLEQGLPIIIGWWSMDRGDKHFDPSWDLPRRKAHDCGHFSVVCGISDKAVYVADPQQSGRGDVVGTTHKPRAKFLATWYDTDTAAYNKVERWYMVPNFTGARFAAKLAGGRDHAPR